MFIIHVTPIVRGKSPARLSYFSTKDVPIGAIVQVPLRKKEVPALVLAKEDARAIKSILRTNIYATKKMKDQKPLSILSSEFVAAATDTADWFAGAPGAVIQKYVPSAILEAADNKGFQIEVRGAEKVDSTFEKMVLQLGQRERLEKYRTIIREAFAQKKSVYVCAPTVHEVRVLTAYLKRGIEKYTFELESTMTKGRQCEAWKKVLKEKHPVLIVATPGFLSIYRPDLSFYIVERETASSYKQMTSPFADTRVLLEKLARRIGATLIVGDTFVQVSTHLELKSGSASEFEEHSRRVHGGASVELVDLRELRQQDKELKKEFSVLSNRSLQLLKEASSEKGHAFVFAPRRGIASQTVCRDCATLVLCAQCKAPAVLHESQNGRILLCHRCGASRSANERCANCDSWNLTSLGVGIERVEAYLRQHMPETPLFRMDSDTAKTPKQAGAISTSYLAEKPAILLGTEMMLPFMSEPFAYGVVSSLDSLLSVPDFRIEEKIFGILMGLREHTAKKLAVETSTPQNAMLVHAASGDMSGYVRDELKLRKELRYPPFFIFIKVTREGAKGTVLEDMKRFVKMFDEYKPRVFSNFILTRNGAYALHALLRVPKERWPDSEMLKKLRALPQTFSIDVNPERVL